MQNFDLRPLSTQDQYAYFIKYCFHKHAELFNGALKFSFEQYYKFWIEHKVGTVYKLKHRNGKFDLCKVAYYPLPYYNDLRALVEFERKDGVDLRDVPVHFLEKYNENE